MSSELRIGVQLPEVERIVRWPEYLAMATSAEDVGFDSVWVGDHLLYRDDGREERGPWDAWSVLAALAATTTRVELGPLVACAAFSSAAQIARRAAAIQEISGGRFVLGLGAGWNETEFRAFGIPTDRRAARFAGAFEIISHLLDGDRVSTFGPFDHLDDAVLLPLPDPRPRIMVGSTGERVLRASLPRADAWNVWFEWFGNHPDGFRTANDRITSMLHALGRDPSEVARTATVFVALDGGASDRPHVAGSPPVTGTHDAIARQLSAFHDAGLEEAILVVSPITEASIRQLGAVIDRLRR